MRLSLSLRLVSAIRALLAVALFTGFAAHAQMNDMSDMDDARYYLLGSVGMLISITISPIFPILTV